MNKKERLFLDSSAIAFNRRHRSILDFNILKYDFTVRNGKRKYTHFDEIRQYASSVKENSINHLPFYLELFEENIKSRGAEVLWADNNKHALQIIKNILADINPEKIVKSKSMISEEIGLNEFLEKLKIESVETDLGEFIVQTAGEKPYHILTPAMHKSKEDVADLFHRTFNLPENSQPHDIALFVRTHLRKMFTEAEVGITGANFIVADIGGIGLTENEGNGLMSVSFPKVHIVIAGIEKIIPSVKQLPFFFQWLGVHGTGQNLSAYNSLLLGPRSSEEKDGPEKMYVILLDNGRTRLYAENDHSSSLKCIRCGTCLNVCPIYKNVGGYTYNSVYTGPIGSVITPFLNGFREYGHLSFACSLCGRCTESCPVQIPIQELLLLNRERKVNKYNTSLLWKKGIKLFSYLLKDRKKMDIVNGSTKNKLISVFKKPWGEKRKLPVFAPISFSQQWITQNN
jgi:L-lactate dehydrogenase complex protein LldF